MLLLLVLCGFAFLAGLVDAVVGGGGLIQLPALFVMLPHAAIPAVLGTNKLASLAGTSAAVRRYAAHVELPWHTLLPAAGVAFVCSFLGARLVALVAPELLRPLILVLLVGVAGYTVWKKDFGSVHAPRLGANRQRWLGVALAAAIGFYDGFFGPGTGSFLIFAFVGLFGFGFLAASASAKVVNLATNLSAVLYFVLTRNVMYELALPMAACNVAGSLLGTRLALRRGTAFIRLLFLAVVSLLILRFGYDLLRR